MIKRKKLLIFPLLFSSLLLASCGNLPNENENNGDNNEPQVEKYNFTLTFDGYNATNNGTQNGEQDAGTIITIDLTLPSESTVTFLGLYEGETRISS